MAHTIVAGGQVARFFLKKAGEFQAESIKQYPCGQSTSKGLIRRQKDYDGMIRQAKIGDGHREANGYTRPGSLKK